MKIKNTNIYYLDYGNPEGNAIILLHGWGQNTEMMDMLGKPFSNKYRIINIDLPGFGKSDEPDFSWSLDDYTDMLQELITKLKLKNVILIGHSFGGRLAIKYAGSHKVKKVVLLGSPFRPKQKRSKKEKILKFLKKVPLLNKLEGWAKERIGSRDYRQASPIMRDVLVKAVNEDLTEYAKKITAPTLIIFGTNDLEVPITEAQELENQ